jgi:hypothetical protein
VHGKPDMVKLTYRLVKEFDAEAVCIISNQKLTEKVSKKALVASRIGTDIF